MENEAPKKHKGGYRQINKTLNICAFEDYLEAQLSHLPQIADIEQISPRVIRVLGQNAGKVSIHGAWLLSKTRPLTVLPVHAPRHKHLHHRDRREKTHHRHRPRYPRMG